MEQENGYYFNMNYKNELIKSMKFLSSKKNTIFLGQSVNFSGNAIFNTLTEIKKIKKIELPVFEDLQMGISIGMAVIGYVPITCYPRFDFLICAMNQLVNHLEKVIIRTSIGSKIPLDGGVQHTQDYTSLFKDTLTEVDVVLLNDKKNIFKNYKKAYERKDNKSTLLIEYGDKYNE